MSAYVAHVCLSYIINFEKKILKESNFLLFVKKKRRLGFPFASRNDIDDQN